MALACVPGLAIPEHREDDQEIAHDVHLGGGHGPGGQHRHHPGEPGILEGYPLPASCPPSQQLAREPFSGIGGLVPPTVLPTVPTPVPRGTQCGWALQGPFPVQARAWRGRRPVGRDLEERIN